MSALLVALIALVALAYQARRDAKRLERSRAFVRHANDRARNAEERAARAEQRLDDARRTLLTVAEAQHAALTARPGPVRVVPRRAPVSMPAPPCVDCARIELWKAIAAASPIALAGTAPPRTSAGEWIGPFMARWGNA